MFAEMQPIGRDRHTEPPVAVEQHIADFGVNDVLSVGAVANKPIYLRGCPAERSIGGLLPRQQTQQQNSCLGNALAETPPSDGTGSRSKGRKSATSEDGARRRRAPEKVEARGKRKKR